MPQSASDCSRCGISAGVERRRPSSQASILYDEAVAAGALEAVTQLVGFLMREWTDLRPIEHAAVTAVLLANQRLIAAEHGILRLRRPECRLRLRLGLLGGKLDHPTAFAGARRRAGGRRRACRVDGRDGWLGLRRRRRR